MWHQVQSQGATGFLLLYSVLSNNPGHPTTHSINLQAERQEGPPQEGSSKEKQVASLLDTFSFASPLGNNLILSCQETLSQVHCVCCRC